MSRGKILRSPRPNFFKAITDPKLLIFDEVTYLYKVWEKTEKASFEDYIEYKLGLPSIGNSLRDYQKVWETLKTR